MKNYTLVGSFVVKNNILISDGYDGYQCLINPMKGTWNMWIEKHGQIVNSVFASAVYSLDGQPYDHIPKPKENKFNETMNLPAGVLLFTGSFQKNVLKEVIDDLNFKPVFIKDNVCYAAFSASADKCHIEANINESKKIYSFTISPQIGMGDTSGGFRDDF